MAQLPVAVKVVREVEDLRALTAASFSETQLYLRGYYADTARGGGFLYYDEDDVTSADDGFLVFKDADDRR